MNKRIGRNDIIFISTLLILIIIFLSIFYSKYNMSGSYVTITVDGKQYGRYRLDEDKEIKIKNASGKVTNILLIKDNCANMTEANCPDKLCVNQKAISKEKETIVCLPNKVVVTVESDDESDFDAIAN